MRNPNEARTTRTKADVRPAGRALDGGGKRRATPLWQGGLHFGSLPGLLLCTCLVGGCATGPTQQTGPPGDEKFVGAWRLISWESIADGMTSFPFGSNAGGLLIYTASGGMSVFLSKPDRMPFARPEARAGDATEKAAAFDSCFAYAGTYEVTEGRVLHRLAHCTFPNWTAPHRCAFSASRADGWCWKRRRCRQTGRQRYRA